jgi:lipopolysaccharide transport system ATP-binding protein
MSDLAISIQGLGKKYRIHHQQRERYKALRDVIPRKFAELVKGDRRPFKSTEDFWVLRDVSFDIKRGEVIGIIGRNGAGKSTLLKILSQITDPSEGRVELVGRVASLLEVGTGFHPELTGRENIFLNGAILGMTRAEINRKFDQIVAFAEVDKFIDTPVKHFSSGMYVRLAFAVAAHLETENLIVDEVLAVGDAEFQKKCLGKMSEVAQGGRTVLFVSHNMGAIRRLTQRCILLDRGRVRVDASVQEAIELYLKEAADGVTGGTFVRQMPRPDGKPFHVHRVTTRNSPDGEPVAQFDCDQPIIICVDYQATRRVPGLYGYMTLQRADGTVLYEGDSRDGPHNPLEELSEGSGTLVIEVPPRVLGAGSYQLYMSFASGSDPAGPEVDTPGIVGQFQLDDTSTPRGNRRNGYLSMILDWKSTTATDSRKALADQ